jgi:hypothetical protein
LLIPFSHRIIYPDLQEKNMNKSTESHPNIDEIYKKPVAGQPIMQPVCTSVRTPVVKVRWCNILKPFHYPKSPSVARYSITCLLDPNNSEHETFIKNLRLMEHKEGTETVLKDDIAKNEHGDPVKSGLHIIKFQTKDPIKVLKRVGKDEREIKIDSELPYGSEVVITFDVIRYQQRILNQDPRKGLNFRPKFVSVVNVASPVTSFTPSQTSEEEAPF